MVTLSGNYFKLFVWVDLTYKECKELKKNNSNYYFTQWMLKLALTIINQSSYWHFFMLLLNNKWNLISLSALCNTHKFSQEMCGQWVHP